MLLNITKLLSSLILALTFFMTSAIAQEEEAIPISSLGIDIKPIFSGGAHSILYQRNYEKSSFRAGLALTFNSTNTELDQPANPPGTNNSGFNMVARLGRTKTVPIGKMGFVYGYDFFLSYQRRSAETENNATDTREETNLFGGGINPVIGINYFVNQNFSLQLETLSLIGYTSGNERNGFVNQFDDAQKLKIRSFDFDLVSSLRIYARIHF